MAIQDLEVEDHLSNRYNRIIHQIHEKYIFNFQEETTIESRRSSITGEKKKLKETKKLETTDEVVSNMIKNHSHIKNRSK